MVKPTPIAQRFHLFKTSSQSDSLFSAFEVAGLAVQKLLVRATTSYVHGSTTTFFIVAPISISYSISISIIPINLLALFFKIHKKFNIASITLSLSTAASLALKVSISLSVASTLLINPNLLRGGKKSAGMDDSAGAASANSANAGAAGDLLRDGPECIGNGGGDDDGSGDHGDGGGDGDAATH
ncbi:hypothetical protein Tco_0789344 [Tanacetum coccineum]